MQNPSSFQRLDGVRPFRPWLLGALAAACFAVPAGPLSAQDVAPARNTLYFEFLGPGGLYSLNYDRLLRDRVSVRVGFSFYSASAEITVDGSTSDGSGTVVLVPGTLAYLAGGGNHKLELGAGPLFGYVSASTDLFGSVSGFLAAASGVVGYRYQPFDGGINLRIAYTPLIAAGAYQNWFGASIGYGF